MKPVLLLLQTRQTIKQRARGPTSGEKAKGWTDAGRATFTKVMRRLTGVVPLKPRTGRKA